MKQTFDRVLRILLVSLLAVTLFACSSGEHGSAAGPAATPAETLVTPSDAPAAGKGTDAEEVQGNDEFAVRAAWVRAAPPGAMMLAGYFTLENRGTDTRQLVGSRSDAFGDVSIHRSFVENGVSRMRPAGPLSIAPGEPLVFEPGGLHLMLMSPRADVSAGQRIPIWLCFEDGDDIEEILVEFEVRRAGS